MIAYRERVGFSMGVAMAALAVSISSASAVWINEIHYDNSGTDLGEGVEVAGAAGTDLSGWSLLFYNGSNGSVYDTVILSGIIDDELNGFGAINFLNAGIQNGAPDGIALYDGFSVIQFLSYEGAFTATSGVASGLTSMDIGVSESGNDAAGLSLQLVGTGTQYGDFSWAAAAASTAGDINTGQTFSRLTPPRPESVPDGGGTFGLIMISLIGIGAFSRSRQAEVG